RENLKSIKNLAKYYHRLINPKHEPDSDVRLALEYISRLEINVAFPFLLQVYSDYGSSKIDKKTFLEVLELIQSFVWRRFIVGLPTNSLNKTFMNLYDKIDPDAYLYSIQKILIQKIGVQRFPKDPEVIEAFKVKDFYNINSKNRIYLLERIENFENTERVVITSNGDITVEHIFPQNPDPRWKIDLGQDEYNLIKENYLNTIGNLTLSGNNGNLGNKPFKKKRDLENKGYKDSRLWMNKYLSTLENWNIEEIEKRFNLIADRFLQIWKYPNIDLNFNIHEEEVNIFDADNPTHKKLDYAIFFDQKIEVGQVTSLYIEVFRKLFEIDPDRFFTSDLGSRISLTKDPKKSKLRTASAINGTYYIESNFDSVGKFERIKYALEVLGFEDELSIKYKS
ncbi:MAG: HNH endonuclease family protein, partial [Prochlorothrix sp.]